MSTSWGARGGHVIVFLRALREVGPVLKGYIRLARAETALAAGSVRGLSVALSLASLGALVTLIALVAALLAWLIQSGLPIWQAVLWIVGPAVLLAAVGAFGVVRRYQLLTLPETRKRLRMLLELIDEDR